VKEETTVAPTFEHIRQQRNEVHLTADLNSLVLSLGDKGQRFISFKMADAAVVFAMVRLIFKISNSHRIKKECMLMELWVIC
jgi:hypothetical protein